MALTPGTKLGPYEVVEPMGAGGMGEVYRARDAKLGRDVAVKVLPEALARDRDRLERFEREARLLGQLNHQNIATLHGVEEHEGRQVLVMELVEGETLGERLTQGRLPVDEALPLFVQIAEGLEAAHGKGIIHRDLKPGNIKITPEGKPKILDFGLAKAFSSEANVSDEMSQSPTLTKGTALGAIMGTASYMSPEQARGKSVDKRTDIWAFGCCFFEALSGQKAFDGETATDVLGAIVHNEPNWDLLPGIPWQIDRLLHRCLQKPVKERVQDIGDARAEIQEAVRAPSLPAARSGERRVTLTTAIAMGLLAAALAGFAMWTAARIAPSDAHEVVSFEVVLSPTETGNVMRIGNPLAISRDGKKLVIATDTRLYLRVLDEVGVRPIPGTEEAMAPFFSPDGESVGFFTVRGLKKVSLHGGEPISLYSGAMTTSRSTGGRGGTWSQDGTIVFSMGTVLQRVPADGGAAESVTAEEAGFHQVPQFLPDNERVLFTRVSSEGPRLAVADSRTGEIEELDIPSRFGVSPRYLPSGYLLYVEPAGLMAVRFDPDRLELLGTPLRVLENVYFSWGGAAGYAASDNGNLVYFLHLGGSTLLKVDRGGAEASLAESPQEFYAPRLSPDGRRLALGVYDPTVPRRDIWVRDLERGSMTRVTFSEQDSTDPVWSPDGERIAFASNRVEDGNWRIFIKSSDGTGEPLLLETSLPVAMPDAWLPDGDNILFKRNQPGSGWDIGRQPVDDSAPDILLGSGFNEIEPSLSPDGRWLAYVSDESGQREVYVRPFPSLEGRWQISTNGGDEPRFSPAGGEIFYRNGDGMMVVSYTVDPSLSFSSPELLFRGAYDVDPFAFDAHNYDVSPDGRSFIMVRSGTASSELRVVVNWIEELERLVP